MKVEIIGSTKPNFILEKQEAIKFSGKSAGICYMPENIDILFHEPEEKSMKRANNTLKNGHHSVFDHVTYNLSLSNIPKILAMILNNEGMYTTSEKSARYTKMEPSKEEKDLYEKWIEIYKKEILKKYPDLEEKRALKLAQENARYLISIFTPATTMEYTTSLRQINYIMTFLENYIKNEPDIPFNQKLKPVLQEFINQLSILKVDDLNANVKERTISLFEKREHAQEFGECYSVNYYGTFAEYAQAQRHRTLRYQLKIEENPDFYVPKIIRNNEELVKEWKQDISSLKELYPQGMLVKINERGTVEDFVLKCKERLCGAAQLEIALQTKEIMDLYLENVKTKNSSVYEYLKPYASGARCTFKGFKCESPCMWGAKGALNRDI